MKINGAMMRRRWSSSSSNATTTTTLGRWLLPQQRPQQLPPRDRLMTQPQPQQQPPEMTSCGIIDDDEVSTESKNNNNNNNNNTKSIPIMRVASSSLSSSSSLGGKPQPPPTYHNKTTATATPIRKTTSMERQQPPSPTQPYVSAPIVDRTTVFTVGMVMLTMTYSCLVWLSPILMLVLLYFVSKFIPYAFRENDDATTRRQLYQQFCNDVVATTAAGVPAESSDDDETQVGVNKDSSSVDTDLDEADGTTTLLPIPDRFRNIHKYVHVEHSYWKNERGMMLHTTIMLPHPKQQKQQSSSVDTHTNNESTKGSPQAQDSRSSSKCSSSTSDNDIVGVVCYCHGYTDHVCFMKLVELQRLCDAGYAVVMIEYEGHGLSDGPLGLIVDWDELIHDVSSYLTHIVKTTPRFTHLPIFLMGESMGGAVAYCVYNRIPTLFRGVVLLCPMCKISDDMLPPKWMIQFLQWLLGSSSSWLGYLPIAPTKNEMKYMVHHLPERGLLESYCPLNYHRRPRLTTARELLCATQHMSESSSTFTAPFLLLHGLEDRITDPQLSQMLYDESTSIDKTIQLYPQFWHALITGESPSNTDRIFRDIIHWLLARS